MVKENIGCTVMADRRKLQGEIERCLKKVTEGVEAFEDTWKKCVTLQTQNSVNNNQKDKYEADLKREIKKLQRLRDQIKTWQASSDIKDKKVLLENRKLIETQMERFKVVERETKTKAYSKEGLGAAVKIDPATKEKGELLNWLAQTIESLTYQKDQFESELENLVAGNKKKKDKDTQDKMSDLKRLQERHTFHIKQLETIMRGVDNDVILPDQLKKIKDDIDYYVECHQDTDFEENEFIYDDLDLDDLNELAIPPAPTVSSPSEIEDVDKLSPTPNSTAPTSPSPSPSLTFNHSKSNSGWLEKVKPVSHSTAVSLSSTTPLISPSPLLNKVSSSVKLNSSTILTSNQNHSVTPPFHTPYAAAVGCGQSVLNYSVLPDSEVSTSEYRQNGIDTTADSSLSSVLNFVTHSTTSRLAPSPPSNSAPSLDSVLSSTTPPSIVPSYSSLSSHRGSFSSILDSTVITNGPHNPGSVSLLDKAHSDYPFSSLKSIAQEVVYSVGLDSQVAPPASSFVHNNVLYNSSQNPTQPTSSVTLMQRPITPCQPSLPSVFPQTLQHPVYSPLTPPLSQSTTTTTIHLNPLLGVAPLGPIRLTKDHLYQLQMQESSFNHLPQPSDSERLRHYLPRNPAVSPAYYPHSPSTFVDSIEFFQNLSTETLFFVFYYLEGTKAQYLAAKALKQQSWRFHTKYMMWFQRHEEPKTITDDFEQGTYIYFDYEKWVQRRKDGFTFEYRYLEDRELN